MKTYSIIRGQHILPFGHRIREFENTSILDFLAEIWSTNFMEEVENLNTDSKVDWSNPEIISEYVVSDFLESKYEKEWGVDILPFATMLCTMIEFGEAPTDSISLRNWLNLIGNDCKGGAKDGLIEILGSTETNQIAWYIFDDRYYDENQRIIKYLFHKDWRLPEAINTVNTQLDSVSKELQNVYCVYLSGSDRLTLSDIIGVQKLAGGNLASVDAFFITKATKNSLDTQDVPTDLLILRALLLERQCDLLEFLRLSEDEILDSGLDISYVLYYMDEGNSNYMYGQKSKDILKGLKKFRILCNEPSRVRANRLQVQVSEHFAQLKFYDDVNKQVITQFFFDDVWVNHNQILASSIFEYAKGVFIEENRDY